MTALTADLSIDGTIASLDGPLAVGRFYHLEDEVVQCRGSVTLNYADVTLGNRWRLSRGEDHTTKATHASGTALTVAQEFAAAVGGGAITVDNTDDPPAEVTTLIALGATISGDEATFPLKVVYGAADPGAVGAGTIWFRSGVLASPSLPEAVMFVRDADDEFWFTPALVDESDGVRARLDHDTQTVRMLVTDVDNTEVSRFEASQFYASMHHNLANGDEVLGLAGETVSATEGNVRLGLIGGKLYVEDTTTFESAHLFMAQTVDPSAGAGVEANLASLYTRINGSAGELWIKTGAADTAWEQVALVP